MKFRKMVFLFQMLIAFVCSITMVSAQANTAESKYLTGKTGSWAVVMTTWASPDARPEVVTGLAADRTMIGDYCVHEVMHPAAGAKMPDFKRLSDLVYNKNETRWDYISIDSRFTIGIMEFQYQSLKKDTIVSYSPYFPSPGFGPKLEGKGRLIRARNLIFKKSDKSDTVQQYMQTKEGKEWLGVMYEYTRIR